MENLEDSEAFSSEQDARPETFVQGLDFYFEEGLMVLTRRYLQNRGYCCQNECRHCPYGYETQGSLK